MLKLLGVVRTHGVALMLGLAVWATGSQSAADELILVEDGVSRAPIVIFEEAPPFTRQAAEELAEYIEKVSGAKPEVIEGEPDPLPERAIWVGYQPVLKKLLPDVSFDFEHPEQILIVSRGQHLALAGRDRWDPDNLTLHGRRREVHGFQQEYGTANAVYTFIQEYLDVRWIWPGELGEDVIERKTIAFEPFEYRYHPQIRSRAGIFAYSRLGRGYGRAQRWSRRQRLQLDSLTVPGGHGFGHWWDKFHQTHPEYFALQPDGTRSGYPGPGRTHKMCLSNPGLWQQWIETNVEQVLRTNPHQQVFDASENDSWASGYCICDNCRAWDHPDGELRHFGWKGLGQKYVAMSERQVKFANQLGRLLKKRYPDKEYYVKIMAYGHSRPVPVEAVPDDNVLVASVGLFLFRPNAADRASPQGTLHRDQYRGWAEITRNMVWRPNQPGGMICMPLVPLDQTIKDFRFVAEHNCIGIYVDTVWEHWATRGPAYYIMAQMAWNPWQDGEAMLDDYFNRGFGKAADPMRDYWQFMEQKWRQWRDERPAAPQLFDQQTLDKAYGILDRAARAVEDEPMKYGKRVAFVRVGLDYTRLLTEARRMMIRFEKSGGKDKEAEDRAREIWVNEIYPLATNEAYSYAIRWGRTSPGNGHMKQKLGYYPDDLHRRKW